MNTVFVGIAGGTGAGKTTLARALRENLKDQAAILHLDSYFWPDTTTHNRPEAIDVARLLADMDMLVAGQTIAVRHRGKETGKLAPCPIIILEGHLLLCFPEIRSRLALSIYVDLDDDERVIRRILRNVGQNGMPLSDVAAWYLSDAKGGHDTYVAPTRCLADVIVWGDLKERSVRAIQAAITQLR